MKRSAIGMMLLAFACLIGRFCVGAGYDQSVPLDWFGVSFVGYTVGEKLATTTGVQKVDGVASGTWSTPPSTVEAVIGENGEGQFLSLDAFSLTGAGATFKIANKPSDGYLDAYWVDCRSAFPVIEGFPSVPDGVKTAMGLIAVNGETNFYGYCKSGWVRLKSPLQFIDPVLPYDQRAEFVNLNGTRHVTYSIKIGGEYVELKDDAGNARLRISAYGPVETVEFRGASQIYGLSGQMIKSAADAGGVVAQGYPMTLSAWFSVMMQGAEVGAELAEDTGVIDSSGVWVLPAQGYSAKVCEEDGERYLCVEPSVATLTGPEFAASRPNSGDIAEIEFSMRFFNDDSALTARLPGDTKAALTVADAAGAPSFHGYVKGGWKALAAKDMQAAYSVWYDLLATFERRDGVLFVSYFVRTFDGFVPLADVSGATSFEAAGSGDAEITKVDLLGDADVKFVNGIDMTIDPERAYYWIGGLYADWHDGTNWSHTAGGQPCANDDIPGPTASMIVNSKAAISMSSDLEVSNIVLNAELVIEGVDEVRSTFDPTTGRVNGLAGDQLSFCGIYGTGRLTVRNLVLRARTDGAAIETGLVADDDTTVGLYCDELAMTVKGDVSGSGAMIVYQSGDTRGVSFAGNNIGYVGTLTETVFDDHDCGRTRFASGAACFPNARVDLLRSVSVDPSTEQAAFGAAGETYEFGAFNGHLITAKSMPTVIIGGRNEDCAIDGVVACGKRSALGYWITTLVKVGSGRLTANVSNVGALDIREGEVKFTSPAPMYLDPKRHIAFNGGTLLCTGFDPSAYVADSVAPITFDDEGIDRVWESPLASSNIGGFRKLGAGTLTLAAIPRYSGATVVETGALVVPHGTMLGAVQVAAGASFAVDLTGVTEDEGVVFYADSTEGLPSDPNRLFINKPAGFVIPAPQHLPNGGVLYSSGSHVFEWSDRVGDGLWSSVANWTVDGYPAKTTPGMGDIVKVAAGKRAITVDMPASVLMILCDPGVPPFRFTTPAITNDTYATDDTSILTVGSGSLPGFSGVGGLSVSDVAMMSASAGETNTFVGPIKAAAFVKSGAGEVVIAGVNSFGALSIEEGTLRLGTHRDIADLRMDFDASFADSFLLDDEGRVTGWSSISREQVLKYDDGEYAEPTTEWFGGRTALNLRPAGSEAYSRYLLQPSNRDIDGASRSLFVLYHATAVADGAFLYAESVDALAGMSIHGSGADHHWVNAQTESIDGFYTGTAPLSTVVKDGEDMLTSWIGTPFRSSLGPSGDNVSEYLGTSGTSVGFKGAVAELVSYTRVLSHPERLAVQRSLLAKWGLEETAYDVLPNRAQVTMNAGTVLDLGGLVQTVGGFTGAGVVANGVLVTADGAVRQAGGSLTIPAVDGTLYALSGRQAELILTGGAGKSAMIVIPEDCMSARVFFEGKVDWRKMSDSIIISGSADGWYTISNIGGGSTIIIR